MDYKEILELTENSQEEVRKTKKKVPSKSSKFTIQYSEGFDMVIDNKEGDRFIFSPSKKEYILKRNDSVIYDLTDEHCSSWIIGRFAGTSKLKINNRLIDTLDREIIYHLTTLAQNDTARHLLEEGLFSLKSTACKEYLSLSGTENVKRLFETKDPEYIWLCDNTSFLTSAKWNYQVLFFMLQLKEIFGTEISRYFAKTYNKSSVEIIDTSTKDHFLSIPSLRELFKIIDPKRFIDYMCFELYTQGVRNIKIEKLAEYMNNVSIMNRKYGCHRSYFSEQFESDSALTNESYHNSITKDDVLSYDHYTVTIASWSETFEDYIYINNIQNSRRNKLIFKDKAGSVVAYSFSGANVFPFIKTINGEAPDSELKAILRDINQKGLKI